MCSLTCNHVLPVRYTPNKTPKQLEVTERKCVGTSLPKKVKAWRMSK